MSEPRGPGRPTKLSDELVRRLVSLLRAGNFIEVACAECGIDPQTYYNWIERGRAATDPEDPFHRFFEAVERARARPERRMLGVVVRAAVGGAKVRRRVTKTKQLRTRPATEEEAGPLFEGDVDVLEEEVTVSEEETLPQWQAARWFLERAYPGRWARRGDVPLDLAGLSDEQLGRIAAGEDPERVVAGA